MGSHNVLCHESVRSYAYILFFAELTHGILTGSSEIIQKYGIRLKILGFKLILTGRMIILRQTVQ
jgi:hypothetical protein